ncbi:hypothetical protein SAMN04488564_12917 [Lentzea waywayandensis]|uniref:Carboxypeptidase regulatory-like domain-containing protein n=1 Tax=Lentzea waywayandensis TaxID=84724 RepID=A0A1I6FJM0_9PSEU|nr:hypothetical protein [Lentzea waywayandensis]SFR30142.1 hypothetical protein SAMN04488564_12917 [Lentzea waywayandensis]
MNADRPFDAVDLEMLRQLRGAWTEADPAPTDLVATVHFALELTSGTEEIMRAVEEHALPVAKGDDSTRTITFDGTELIVMVSIAPAAGATARIDGWLTPAGVHQIELRLQDGLLRTSSDDGGRFAFDRVPWGLVQLVVRADDTVLVTPAMVLS